MQKRVYMFDEGHKGMRQRLGGKGANLAEMTQIGLPVPYGFTVTTDACHDYYEDGKQLSSTIKEEIIQSLRKLEESTNKQLGDKEKPLFVSVRSGSVVSMPGMMDTVLNLGMNDETVEAQKALTGNGRFAYDSYRRFIQMFSNVVLGIDMYFFESHLDEIKEEKGYVNDPEMTEADWKEVVASYQEIVEKHTRQPFPQDPIEQLMLAVNAVFDSWNNKRAIIYRNLNKIPDSYGTAVNIQSMVFGNTGDDSGTGVAFTRNPSTGENLLYGEFLLNAQGEDVVAGIRTPQPIAQLESAMPEVYKQFVDVSLLLEKHYRDMQDIEFTVEQGKLYILQTRNGKRTAASAVRVAVEMAQAGILTKKEALLRVEPEQLNQLLHRRIDDNAELNQLTKGLPASPGAATGKVVFDSEEAQEFYARGEKVILIRPETTPDDIQGIIAAEAVVTSRGGMTSHAAVVARGMGKPCICGVESLKIDTPAKTFKVGDIEVRHLDTITIDGGTGAIMLGEVPMIEPKISEQFNQLLQWADEEKAIEVRANADNPEDSSKALELGAKGVGLCRTEHMFMQPDRQKLVKEMILSSTVEDRKEALEKLLPIQQEDFEGIFGVMRELPVTVRLLDPPLHEFLPDKEELIVEVTTLRLTEPQSEELKEKEFLLKKVNELAEVNPMLGHRGCRLGLIHPEIYAMQAEAIFNAAITLHKKGIQVKPEIMIPLVGHSNELKIMRQLVIETAEKVLGAANVKVEYTIGTMIEVPRAALTADQIAYEADFFSFGTNDLTQTTFGYSRDDAEGKFLQSYLEDRILPENPFRVLDNEGVGQLVEMGVKKGRAVKPSLKTGICGEHGGEENSIEFCLKTGLDYVSCSPYRVPLARLAAAQATIRNEGILTK
ncbi:pyruvate phosphate dikinase [Alkalihalobacillus alcalophilus ATCC 27647 = CGMCC 1.3604]|uniref:Pyruvate, phosphate dikinase n=1 Tax=Alkalihalobacillus alcalophilus ATCC 27647 = CGMCC 1.3604 TaxID=1218173 RepID=A0A094YZB0_ALKAL|nr:pyruvate, phosphate dikinase [Alkalihalobacillus alcalophilus]KGA98892.1 pyruvate phosphate dikinase [Alkalihalobacillus alcalophilus ATCC 27647 = CGMCC 1.3604]MED1560530.1 pyruvate, phosphate dikinase [Alkalihalobacillus alcalophilus]THG88878.1 pyruvate phosphate dikinase [Alkalihalobacillus alcalophilus ATCC 27647 = CGMCC 1.3604]